MIPRTPWCPGQSMHGAERLSSEPPAVKDASRLVKSLSRGLWVCFPGGLGLAGGGGGLRGSQEPRPGKMLEAGRLGVCGEQRSAWAPWGPHSSWEIERFHLY